MRVLTLEPLDEFGHLRCDGARHAAIAAGFGNESFKATLPVPLCPFQQGVDRNGGTFRVRDVVLASGDLLSTPGQLAAYERLDDQRRDQAITKESNFFEFTIHGIPP